ncbi:3'-5' exonuclease [Psychroflexus lacisalsi]|jgi:DNA polymerase-3 subunit epsilon|uniref:3'-5' exonuclease n=1 Tax=Psychroflexus lacisalsi TaxID=503928 RepID=A0ABN1KDF9_9FLAO|nr:3'-5' exonuclease [Psychroflexus lacisalsi]MBZ9620214.1 3'-5' exonuclease [Psychroflexus lacisalsi]
MGWFKDLFKKKEDYPEFWQAYAAEFKQSDLSRVIVLDCETTGLNPVEDKILSIGAVALHDNVIHVENHFSVFLHQKLNKPESIAVHGIVKNKMQPLTSESDAIKQLLKFLGNSKILGHHIQFDIQMINTALATMGLPKLKNQVADTNDLYSKFKGVDQSMHKSLDELCDEFKIPKKDRHTALGDAFLTAQVYQRLVISV